MVDGKIATVLKQTMNKYDHLTSTRDWRSRDSSVGIAIGYELEDEGVGIRVPVRQKFSLLYVVQTGSGIHPASYRMGTGCSFLGGKAVGA
jgi:hypothetical protein